MGCTKSSVITNIDIAIKDGPKSKIVNKDVPESLKSYLKQVNQELSHLELSGGHSIYGESFILEAKSLSNNSSIRYMYRQFKPVRDFNWECYISKEMGELGVAPKIAFEDHEAKFWLQEFVENSVILRPLLYFPECLKQVGEYLKKFHTFSPKEKAPDSYPFFGRAKARASQIIEKQPVLERFKKAIEGVENIQKIFEKNAEKCLCHNDFGYGANILWDKKRVWLIDFEFSGIYFKYYDIGALISLLIMTEEDRESFLEGYYGGKRSEKEEALIYIGEQYGLLCYCMFCVTLMGKLPEDINEKFFEDILPWNERRTGKAKINRAEIPTIHGNVKVATMMLKQAELNMKSEKYQNALKILGM